MSNSIKKAATLEGSGLFCDYDLLKPLLFNVTNLFVNQCFVGDREVIVLRISEFRIEFEL